MIEAFIKILDTSFLYDDDVFSSYYKKMPEYRRKKIDFFKFKKDKCLSLGAGILMNDLIQHAEKKTTAQADSSSFEIAFTEQGKPFRRRYDTPLREGFFALSGCRFPGVRKRSFKKE